MSWKDDDEVTITFGTLNRASKESFDMGYEAARSDFTKDYVRGVLDGRDYERERIIYIIDGMDLTEFVKDDVIHAIAELGESND